MHIYTHLEQLVTLSECYKKQGRFLKDDDLGIIHNGAIVFDEQKIHWVGPTEEIPSQYHQCPSTNFSGHTLTPEIVDSHTHLVFGGDRSDEYTMKISGVDYREIAKSGGGILSTMRATRESSREDLFNSACERIERLNSYGVGSIEIKSGYGLNFDKEYEVSKIIDDLKRKYAPKIQIINTFMAAHAIPPEFSSSREYLDVIVIPLMKKLHSEGIIDCVDIFHEAGYFTSEDTETFFKAAIKLNLPFKSHADEFEDLKGAKLAAEMGAISTDHLLATQNDGIEALAKSQTIATFLPGTGFFLGKKQVHARAFLDAGCRVAIASDYNPGSCHLDNVILAASLAAPIYKMNLAEIWSAITFNAAHACHLKKQGVLLPSFKPRFSIFKVDKIDKITYHWGRNFCVNIN